MKTGKFLCIFALALVFALIASALPVTSSAAAELSSASIAKSDIVIRRSGKTLDVGLYIIDDTTYVPIRAFALSLGIDARVSFDDKTKTASVKYGSVGAQATAGENYVSARGRYFYSSRKNLIIDGTMYIPIRALAPVFGYDVDWDASTRSVILSYKGALKSADDVYDYEDLYWLSRIISAESRDQTLLGQIAVGTVVANRVASGEYPSSYKGVIFDRKYGVQFTPVANGSVYDYPSETSVIAAKITLEGYRVDDEVIYFMNDALARSRWIKDNCEYCFTIGEHSFWK